MIDNKPVTLHHAALPSLLSLLHPGALQALVHLHIGPSDLIHSYIATPKIATVVPMVQDISCVGLLPQKSSICLL